MRSLFFLLIILVFGCGSPSIEDDRSVFNYNESNGISSLDPAAARNLENMWAVNQIFDGLVRLDEKLNVVPSVAQRWEILDSGRTYRFFLREDVVFHPSPLFSDTSGRQVVANDFVYSFERILDPKTASPGKWIFDKVDKDHPQGAFHAINDSVLDIHLKNPFPVFLGLLSTQYANVLPKEVVEYFGSDFRANPVGCGPFKLGFWMEDVALVLHKNDHYFRMGEAGVQLPYLDAVKISFVKDMTAEYLGLLQGKFDFMSGLHPAYKDEVLTPDGELRESLQDKIRLQKIPFVKTDYIGILVDDSIMQGHALSDRRVRQALNYAVDRESMVRYLRNNAVFEAGHGFIPRGLPSHDTTANYGYDFDLAKARTLLAEAGFPGGEGLPELELSTTSDYVDLCEFLQFQWQEIGVKCNIDVLASSSHREKVASSGAMLFRKSWLADYPDAENFLGLFYSKNFTPGGPNYTHYYSAQFDSLFESAIREVDDLKRRESYIAMDSLVMADAPVIPLFYDQVSHFVRNEVQGLNTDPVNMLDLSTVRKTR